MEKQRMHTLRMVMLAMMVAIGVVISPILRIEGMCSIWRVPFRCVLQTFQRQDHLRGDR